MAGLLAGPPPMIALLGMKATRKANALAWLRRECCALKDVEEKTAWGHPNFHVGGHTIATFEVFRGRPSIAILAERDSQDFLIKRFGLFKTPYSGRYGWVSAWVDAPAPWTLIRSLLKEAHDRASTEPRGVTSTTGRRSRSSKRTRKSIGRSIPKRDL
jgi:predicted DNA-binding protein (MmcQ/YjbR family)